MLRWLEHLLGALLMLLVLLDVFLTVLYARGEQLFAADERLSPALPF